MRLKPVIWSVATIAVAAAGTLLVLGGLPRVRDFWRTDNVVSLSLSPSLAAAGVQVTRSFESQPSQKVVLRQGEQRFAGEHGKTYLHVVCPGAQRELVVGGWLSINRNHGIPSRLTCVGTLDEINCEFVAKSETERTRASCTKPLAPRG